MKFIELLTEKLIKHSGMTFPNIKGWTISTLGSEYTDDGAENIRYTKKVKGSKVNVDFSDLEAKNKTYRATTDGSTFTAQDGDVKMTSTKEIRGDWKNVKDIPTILSQFQKDFNLGA